MKATDGKIIHFGLPEELHKKIRKQALEEGLTLQAMVIKALAQYIAGVEGQEK